MASMLLIAVLIALSAAPLRAATPGGPAELQRVLHQASVVLDTGCSGVVAESQQLILTARHCIKGGQQLRARLSTGATRTAWVVATNEASDQAVLFLEEPARVEPLSIARRAQIPGTVLYFEGNPGRPRFQRARLERIDRCSSLPDLPNALHTGIAGVPGDSGAALIDGAGRVVGLVHGGSRCHIATPANTLIRLVDGVYERDWVDRATDGMPRLSRGGRPHGRRRSGSNRWPPLPSHCIWSTSAPVPVKGNRPRRAGPMLAKALKHEAKAVGRHEGPAYERLVRVLCEDDQ